MFATAREILKDAGFNLRKFYSNSDVRTAGQNRPFTSRDTTYRRPGRVVGGQKPHSGEQKVLGIWWNLSTDRLLIGFDKIVAAARALTPTKRSIVSLVGRFYDPIGFLAAVVIHFKIHLQELCRAKSDWDKPLPADLLLGWSTLSASLQCAQPLSIPRCYLDGVPGEPVSATLCGFCDTSQKA